MSAAYGYQIERPVETPKFVVVSGVLHALLAMAILTMNMGFPQIKAPPVVEVEFLSANSLDLIPVPSSKHAAPKKKSVVTESPNPKSYSEVLIPKVHHIKIPKKIKAAKVHKLLPPAPAKIKVRVSKAKIITQAKPQAKAGRKIAPMVYKGESVVEAPQLNTQDFERSMRSKEVINEKSNFDTQELNSAFEEVEDNNPAGLEQAKKEFSEKSDTAKLENEEALKTLEKENKERSDRMAAVAAQRRAEQIAGGLTNSRKSSVNGTGTGDPQGGNIRSLEDLRQVNGNVKPRYDYADRLAGRQGEIVFLAYVTRSGQLNQFKMIKGTGHQTLDQKTLKALQTWKFYPGQEGWVEIPFKWDLKGGAQEMPARLRVK